MNLKTRNGSWLAGMLAAVALAAVLLLAPAAWAVASTTISGDLERPVGTAEVPADTVLRGDLRVGTGNAVVHGRVEGDVQVLSGEAHIFGEVTGDVRVTSGRVTLGPNARVGGKVIVLEGTVSRAPGSVVDGEVVIGELASLPPAGENTWIIDDDGIRGPGVYIGPDGIRIDGLVVRADEHGGVRVEHDGRAVTWAFRPFAPWHFLPHLGALLGLFNPILVILRWAGLFALSALVLAVMPEPLARMAAALDAQPVRAGLVGLVVILLIPVVLILLAITIIGIPVAVVGVLAVVAAKFIGYVAVSLWLGERLARVVPALQGENGMRFLRLLAGSLALALAGMVPGLGFLVAVAGACLSFGAVWTTRLGTQPWTPPPGSVAT